MDRHVKIYSKKGYLFAEMHFYYERRNQVTAKTIEYSMYETQDYETGDTVYNTYESGTDIKQYVSFKQFATMKELREHDIDFAKKELRYNKMGNPSEYNFVYGTDTQQRRYFIGRHHTKEIFGVANFLYNFEENTKEMKFMSGKGFGWDFSLTSHCLETNMNVLARLPFSENWEDDWNYSGYDIAMIDSW